MMVALLMLVVFLAIIFLGVPISTGMGIATLTGLIAGDYKISVLPQLLQQAAGNATLISIPYFILAANLMNGSGITKRLFDWADALVGWMAAGMAHVNVIASVIFAGISGTANADAAGLGMIEIEAMDKQGYSKEFSASITLASSVLGPIIPPSVPFIVYAMLSELSVVDLFLAGILPGLVLAIVLMIANYILYKKGKIGGPKPRKFDGKRLWVKTKEGFFALLAPIILLVCIFSGVVTATESGIIAVVYSLIAAIIYREMSIKQFIKALKDTVLATASILFLVGMGYGIGWVMTIERVPQNLTKAMLAFSDNTFVLLMLINLFLLVLGCFMDGTTIRLITVPLFLPVLDAIGFSRLQFGVVHTFNTLIGFCTPPVGVGLMIMCTVANVKFSKMVKSFLPFYVVLFLVLVLLTFVPQITLWLPGIIHSLG